MEIIIIQFFKPVQNRFDVSEICSYVKELIFSQSDVALNQAWCATEGTWSTAQYLVSKKLGDMSKQLKADVQRDVVPFGCCHHASCSVRPHLTGLCPQSHLGAKQIPVHVVTHKWWQEVSINLVRWFLDVTVPSTTQGHLRISINKFLIISIRKKKIKHGAWSAS